MKALTIEQALLEGRQHRVETLIVSISNELNSLKINEELLTNKNRELITNILKLIKESQDAN